MDHNTNFADFIHDWDTTLDSIEDETYYSDDEDHFDEDAFTAWLQTVDTSFPELEEEIDIDPLWIDNVLNGILSSLISDKEIAFMLVEPPSSTLEDESSSSDETFMEKLPSESPPFSWIQQIIQVTKEDPIFQQHLNTPGSPYITLWKRFAVLVWSY